MIVSTLHFDPDKCLACTTCVVHCPVARVTPKFSGPRMIGPAYERFRLLGLHEDETLQYCANCKNCDISCPHGVPVSAINMMARAEQCRKKAPGLRDWIVAHGETMAKWLAPLPAALKNFGMDNPLTRRVLDAIGIAEKSPLPRFAPRAFRSLLRRLRQPAGAKKVAFFPGCYVSIYNPATGIDLVRVLNRAGYAVEAPDGLVCCGLPLISNGFLDEARANAEKNMAVIARCREEGVPVIAACPSCRLMFMQDLREFFPEIVERHGEPDVGDAMRFILGLAEKGEIDLPPKREGLIPRHFIYHAPCHLRAQGQGLPSLDLLRMLPGVTVDNADAGCCGISGSYGFKSEKYAIGQKIGEELFRTIRENAAETVVTECGTCRQQIMHGTGKACLHPVSVLRRILDRG